MPSRVIISSVNRNTPSIALDPLLAADVARRPSISVLSRLACRHMCTMSVATSTAAVSASTPSHNAWFDAR